MKKFIDVLKFTDMPEPVDCGGCPASFSCMADGDGGNGHKFNCCGATGYVADENNERSPLIVLDCQQNTFYQSPSSAKVKLCPLCSGDIVEATLRGYADNHYYVPTVYAKKPLNERLRAWRRVLNRRQKDVDA